MEEQQQLPFEVRDMRHKEKFQIDDVYLNGYAKKCGIYATGVYVSLCRHADSKTQECWPSIKRIAEELNIGINTVKRAIKILEENHLIIKKRLGKKLNNRYILLDKSEWSDSPVRAITSPPQGHHYGPHRDFHSKDTQLRNTHNKEDFNKLNELRRTKDALNKKFNWKL
jgi:DNA-binding Lrp family transcriptional regulator